MVVSIIEGEAKKQAGVVPRGWDSLLSGLKRGLSLLGQIVLSTMRDLLVDVCFSIVLDTFNGVQQSKATCRLGPKQSLKSELSSKRCLRGKLADRLQQRPQEPAFSTDGQNG